MIQDIFENAKFGDMFLTAENKQALFLRFAENAENEFAILYVEGWGNVQVFRHNGKALFDDAAHNIISKQKEPVSERFAFKAIPRLLEMIEPTDRAKAYTAKLADAFEVEGYSTDAKIVRESIKIMNGEKVPMATMDDEPVSKDLDDQRFAKEMDAVFALPSSETKNTEEEPLNWEYAIAKHFFKLGLKAQQEPVSEDLEEAIGEYCSNPDNFATWIGGKENDDIPLIVKAIKFGANWQKKQILDCNTTLQRTFELGKQEMKQQMMANAVDGAFIRRNRYTKKNVLNGLDMTCDAIQGFRDKDKIKVLFIKED